MLRGETRHADRGAAEPRGVISGLRYLGALALLLMSGLGTLLQPTRWGTGFSRRVLLQLDGLLGMGIIFVALVHAPLGSFLAMQAYFMATFREASGAVVGVGMVRNLAPLLSGFILATLLATRIVPELRRRPWTDLDADPDVLPDRDQQQSPSRPAPTEEEVPERLPERIIAVRLVCGVLAGPVLALWGAAIGFLLGLIVSRAILSVSPGIYCNTFLLMVEPVDALGLVVKSMIFGLLSALLACHEGLRSGPTPAEIRTGAARAIALAVVGILICNDCWFTLNYLSGAPFGPAVAAR